MGDVAILLGVRLQLQLAAVKDCSFCRDERRVKACDGEESGNRYQTAAEELLEGSKRSENVICHV